MKLLLVDDEEYVIESIKRNLDLTETGVNEVYTAFSVQQAKNIMGMVDIDIVISDIVMPGGTGFDFVECNKGSSRSTKNHKDCRKQRCFTCVLLGYTCDKNKRKKCPVYCKC